MPTRGFSKPVISLAKQTSEQLPDVFNINPNDLRDRIYKAFSVLPPQDYALMRDRLLDGLRRAGIHMGSCLFILGIPAETYDDLTLLDIAKLIRYVRMNRAEAFRAVAGDVGDLLAAGCKSHKATKRAA